MTNVADNLLWRQFAAARPNQKWTDDALGMAFGHREVTLGLIVHSDRGVQYRSTGHTDYLRSKDCVPSMSRKGNCWDNAPMESFFSRLKVELIYPERFASFTAAKSAIFE